VNFIREAIEWVNMIEDENRKIELEMNLNLILYQALMATKGTKHPDVLSTIKRSEELCVHYTEESELAFSALIGLIMHFLILPDFGKMNMYLEKGFAIAEKLQQKEYLSFLSFVKGHSLFTSGDFVNAVDHFDTACKLYDLVTELQLRSPGDIKVFTLSSQALLYSAKGEITKAMEVINKAMEWAEKLKHNYSKGMAFGHELGVFHYTGNKEMVKKRTDGYLSFMQENDLMTPLVITQIIKSWAYGDLEGIKQFFPLGEQLGFNQIASYWNFIYAQIEFANGLFNEALKRCEFYIDYALEKNELFYLPELYRLKGLCVLQSADDFDTAKSCFTSSMEIARRTGAALFELRSMNELYIITEDKSFIRPELEELILRFRSEPEFLDKKETELLLRT
jgi:tetratricopeptide (TPR) repeat protein